MGFEVLGLRPGRVSGHSGAATVGGHPTDRFRSGYSMGCILSASGNVWAAVFWTHHEPAQMECLGRCGDAGAADDLGPARGEAGSGGQGLPSIDRKRGGV